jgi:hypothetical protein
MTKIAGSGSGSISHRHGSADLDPNPHQNVMDPQHCLVLGKKLFIKRGEVGTGNQLGRTQSKKIFPEPVTTTRGRKIFEMSSGFFALS